MKSLSGSYCEDILGDDFEAGQNLDRDATWKGMEGNGKEWKVMEGKGREGKGMIGNDRGTHGRNNRDTRPVFLAILPPKLLLKGCIES